MSRSLKAVGVCLVVAAAAVLAFNPFAAASGTSASKPTVVKAKQDGPWKVGISGTPKVAISGTPTVGISGTPTVTVSGTPTVQVTNTPSVNVNGSVGTTPVVPSTSFSHYVFPVNNDGTFIDLLSDAAAGGQPKAGGQFNITTLVISNFGSDDGQVDIYQLFNATGTCSQPANTTYGSDRIAAFFVPKATTLTIPFSVPLHTESVSNICLDAVNNSQFANAIGVTTVGFVS